MSEEYIYLRDYVKILRKRKWIVILVPIISVLTTAIFVFAFQKPKVKVYETVATIQNGFIQRPIIEKQEGFELIKISAGYLAEKIQFEDIPNTLWFRMKIKSETPGLDLINKLVQDYIDYGNNLYNNQFKIYTDKINVLQERKRILEEAINEIQNAISGLPSIKGLTELQKFDRTDKINLLQERKRILEDAINEIQNAISKLSGIKGLTELQKFDKMFDYNTRINSAKRQILDIMFDYNTRINSAKNQILDTENTISDIKLGLVNTKQFMIKSLVKSTELTIGIKPNKKTKLLISAVLGLMGGIILAFAVENWSLPAKESE